MGAMRIHAWDLLAIIDPRVRVANSNHKFAVMLSRQLCAAENRALAARANFAIELESYLM
jgi:hypothetical protein